MRQMVTVGVIKAVDKKAGKVIKSAEKSQKAKGTLSANTSHPSLNQWWKNDLRTVCLNWPFKFNS